MDKTQTIAQSNNFIVLDRYTAKEQSSNYQSEAQLESELIQDLIRQGYEHVKINNETQLKENLKTQIERLNHVQFNQTEWTRFLNEYLNNPNDNREDKARKVHENDRYSFAFDNGKIKNIALFDKKILAHNQLQVISQFRQDGSYHNRYDVTILVNGLPLVQIELKKRGVALREGFNQIDRYQRESFNHPHSLFKYIQIFIISNGTDTRYFANTIARDKSNFSFTMNWAKSDNSPIKDLKDFTATFFTARTLLEVLLHYSILNIESQLLIMRPYQIAATERILWKIKSATNSKNFCHPESGGYIWHTTGSGKTLTSFKAAQLATQLDFIDKVLFVVDRKDLDYQTMREYQKFSADSVNRAQSTQDLEKILDNHDQKIIVTTIQKLNHLMKRYHDLDIYKKHVVFIFDECHRSQFGEAQKNIKKHFKKFHQFGFTGTPIFAENSVNGMITATVFGPQLHAYKLTNAISDKKVLKFKVDYQNVIPKFKEQEQQQDEASLTSENYKKAFNHPERIKAICQYILDNYKAKTHRLSGKKGFNAMFATSSVESAKLYYQEFKALKEKEYHKLNIATIFSFAPNEEAITTQGEIIDESLNPDDIPSTSKEFLAQAIDDYNYQFHTNFDLSSDKFQNYYKDISERTKKGDIDLLIVVGMFLTGFDAPQLNSLFVDKNLRYHGLIQAYSRTNRIYNATKPFGNIITFRDLEQPTIDAIKLFGDDHNENILLERPFWDYIRGFIDDITHKYVRGLAEVTTDLKENFLKSKESGKDPDKKTFIKKFNDMLRMQNILSNYNEYSALKQLKETDPTDIKTIEDIRQKNDFTKEEIKELQAIDMPTEREQQDMRSLYNDIRHEIQESKKGEEVTQPDLWDDVVFEVDLLKSQEIDLDYILALIFDYHTKHDDKEIIMTEIKRMLRASLKDRAKERLVMQFIEDINFEEIISSDQILRDFYKFAQDRQKEQAYALIKKENLKQEPALRYIEESLKKGFPNPNGTDLRAALPDLSPLNIEYRYKKEQVYKKIEHFIEIFRGIGGNLE